MKSLLYLFRRYKLASSLNLLGLILAFAGSYILLTQIRFIGSFNHGIKDYENIYHIYVHGVFGDDQWTSSLNRPIIEKMKECPQVESVGYMRSYGETQFDKDGSTIVYPSYMISEDMLTTINTELVDGTLQSEAQNGGIFIPASLAEKYFGEVMVAGKPMKCLGGEMYTVTGVYKDFPDNSNFSNAVYVPMGDENIDDSSNWNYSAYIRSRSDADISSVENTLKTLFIAQTQDRLASIPPEYAAMKDEIEKDINAMLERIHFVAMSLGETYLNGYDHDTDTGNKTVYYILQSAILLLLLVALINFANFSMAQAPIRLRGINTRKVMGESTWVLRLHLVAEGIFLCLCAFAISIFIVYCIAGWEYIAEYTLGSVSLSDNIGIVLLLAIISIAVGIICTMYSACYITSFPPALALKGNYGLSPRGRKVRQLLVAVQLVLAFVMFIFVGVIYSQRDYIYSSDYGYEKDALLFGGAIELPSEQSALRSELEMINGIESVAFSTWAVGLNDVYMSWDRGHEEQTCCFTVIPVDWKFLRTCGIDIIEGRDFNETDGDVYIINEAMKKKYQFLEVDKPLVEDDLPIVGVCKNFRAFTTRKDNNAEPVAFVIYGQRYADWGNRPRVLYIRLAPNTNRRDLRNKIDKVLKTFYRGESIPEMRFMDNSLEHAYKDEMRFMRQIEASTMLAFLITIIGVFCLTMFETEYRRKEIAIRKVMGSSVGDVLSLFTQRYALPLVFSFIIAAPIGYYISEQWLQNFAEHTPILWWIFPLAFLFVSTVVLLTVIIQCWRVATMNPTESIKTE